MALEESISVLPLPSEGLEMVIVQICYTQECITLCALCIPPNSDLSYFQSLLSHLSHLVVSSMQVIILGDFNFPDICWTTLTAPFNISNLFCEFLFEYNIEQLITTLMHIKGNILDLVISHNSDTLVTFQLTLTYFIRLSLISFSILICSPTITCKQAPRCAFDFCKVPIKPSLPTYWTQISVIALIPLRLSLPA